jgi:hypothetical protein
MKKTFTILTSVLTILFFNKANAQDDKVYPKSFIAFIGGTSSPLSNFKSADYYNNQAAFAKRGATFGLEGAWYFHKNFALTFGLSFQDQGQLTANDAQILANGYNKDFAKNSTVVSAVNRYQALTFMVGPQYSYMIKKFTIDLRATAGFFKSNSTPAITVGFDNSTSATAPYQQSSTATSLAYGASLGLRYSLGDSWDIGIREGYLDASGIKIKNTGDTGAVGRYVTKLPVTEMQTVISLTVKF